MNRKRARQLSCYGETSVFLNFINTHGSNWEFYELDSVKRQLVRLRREMFITKKVPHLVQFPGLIEADLPKVLNRDEMVLNHSGESSNEEIVSRSIRSLIKLIEGLSSEQELKYVISDSYVVEWEHSSHYQQHRKRWEDDFTYYLGMRPGYLITPERIGKSFVKEGVAASLIFWYALRFPTHMKRIAHDINGNEIGFIHRFAASCPLEEEVKDPEVQFCLSRRNRPVASETLV